MLMILLVLNLFKGFFMLWMFLNLLKICEILIWFWMLLVRLILICVFLVDFIFVLVILLIGRFFIVKIDRFRVFIVLLVDLLEVFVWMFLLFFDGIVIMIWLRFLLIDVILIVIDCSFWKLKFGLFWILCGSLVLGSSVVSLLVNWMKVVVVVMLWMKLGIMLFICVWLIVWRSLFFFVVLIRFGLWERMMDWWVLFFLRIISFVRVWLMWIFLSVDCVLLIDLLVRCLIGRMVFNEFLMSLIKILFFVFCVILVVIKLLIWSFFSVICFFKLKVDGFL